VFVALTLTADQRIESSCESLCCLHVQWLMDLSEDMISCEMEMLSTSSVNDTGRTWYYFTHTVQKSARWGEQICEWPQHCHWQSADNGRPHCISLLFCIRPSATELTCTVVTVTVTLCSRQITDSHHYVVRMSLGV